MKYSLVRRGDPRNAKSKKRVYASAQSHRVLSLEEVAESIAAHGCVYNTGDFKAVVNMLAEAVREKLRDGYQVELDELGKFFVTLDCEGAESAEAFEPSVHIRDLRIHWRPSTLFAHMRKGVTFEESADRRTQRRLLREAKEQG